MADDIKRLIRAAFPTQLSVSATTPAIEFTAFFFSWATRP
jgi:hypothetical protein